VGPRNIAPGMRGNLHVRSMLAAGAAVSVAGLLSAPGAAGPRGGLDRTFGDRGRALVEGIRSCLPGEGGCPITVGLAIQRSGAVVVAGGTMDRDCRSSFALARLRGGKPDPSFGRGGRVLTSFASRSAVATTAVAGPDRKIVAVGDLLEPAAPGTCADPRSHLHLGGALGFALARYLPSGKLDPSFGADGKVVTHLDQAGTVDALLQPDGKIVAVGVSGTRFALVRYQRDGTLDRSFGGDGIVLTSSAGDYAVPGKAALDRAGRILVPASINCYPCALPYVVRYTPSGNLDPTFGRGGRASARKLLAWGFRAVAVSGRQIVAAGTSASGRFAISRFSSAGRLERGFGRDGTALSRPLPGWALVTDLAIQKNGKIVAVGGVLRRKRFRFTDFVVVRLLPRGSVDPTFGSAGTARIDFGSQDTGETLVLQRDGKLVVAGVVGQFGEALGVARQLPGTCSVPALRGKVLTAARMLLAAGNCRLGRTRVEYSRRVSKGRVLRQEARAGSTLPDYAAVDVVVSSGGR
jgi:uncharacterized delta-60 repeat protein